MKYRIEKDTMGEVKVPFDAYWGAQTQRSKQNFRIGREGSMPKEIIEAFAYLKKAAALTNAELGVLAEEKAALIARVCDEILEDKLEGEFSTCDMANGFRDTVKHEIVNEVIANRAHVISGGKLGEGERFIHPNDDVNKSQSSNDTFPTAMHIAAYKLIMENTIPGIEKLRNTLEKKAKELNEVVKIGRTHLMDATPLTIGQEFSGYVSQLDHGFESFKKHAAYICRNLLLVALQLEQELTLLKVMQN